MKIIDCFTFYNEIDMLRYRLATLYDYVDYFVIVESTHTHVGKEKEMYFNIEDFSMYKDKIVYVIVKDFQYIYPNIDFNKSEQWLNEKHQRNCIVRGLEQINLFNKLDDDDILVISDLDEIIDRNILTIIRANNIKIEVNSLEQDFYYYNLNSRLQDKWYHAKILSYSALKKFQSNNLTLSDIRAMIFSYICNGGWHLSYFGDKYFIKNKIENFGHQELNNDNFTDLEKIEERKNNAKDLYARHNHDFVKISIADNKYLPHEYDKYLSKYICYM